MKSKRIISGIVLAALATVLLTAVLALLTDAPAMIEALRGFPIPALLAMLALALLGVLARGLRWGWLMRLVGHPVSMRDALYLQLSGQSMALTPGRVGEAFKPWLARDIGGMSMTRGIALVFAERIADLIGVCILSLGGLSAIDGNRWTLVAAMAAVLLGTTIASSRWFHSLALRIVKRQTWAREHYCSVETVSETIRLAMSWRTLAWSVPVSLLAWGLEGLGFALCLSVLGFVGVGPLTAVSIYAVSTLVGALTFLPGGIGLTEASMAGILIAAGMQPGDASAATVITRITTMWWGVGIGWLVMASRPAVLRTAMRLEVGAVDDVDGV